MVAGVQAVMRKAVTVTALVVALGAASGAHGDDTPPSGRVFYNGNALFQLCQSANYQDLCAGYVAGVADALAGEPVSGFRACIPTEVSLQQAQDVVTRFLVAHSEWRDFAALSLVAAALAGAFPCR